jgi:hypothetical protein
MKHRPKGPQKGSISKTPGGPVFVSPEGQKRMSLDTRQPQANPWRQVPEMGSALPPDRGVRRLVRSDAALRRDDNKSTGQRA